MTREERQIIIRNGVIKIEAIDKSLPAFEGIAKANETIAD